MSTIEKIMYGITGLVMLVFIVTMLDVACMVFLDMRLTEAPRRAAIAAGLLSSTPEPATPAPMEATPAPKPVKVTPTPKPVKVTPTPKPVVPVEATPTARRITSYQGVKVGMPADDVLKVWGKGLRSEQVGSDAQGLIVEWVYEDAILVMKRWEIGGVTCYRVAEIRLR